MLSPLQYEYSFTILEIQRCFSPLARWWRMVDDKKISGVYNVHCADLSPPSVQIMHYTAIQSAMNALFPHTTLLISWHLASLRVCYLTFEHLGPAQSFALPLAMHDNVGGRSGLIIIFYCKMFVLCGCGFIFTMAMWRWQVSRLHLWFWLHILCSIFEYLWSFMCF